MTGLYGVMDASNTDEIWTYEADSAEHAVQLYFESDVDSDGVVVRVWNLGRHPKAFVKVRGGAVLPIDGPESVYK